MHVNRGAKVNRILRERFLFYLLNFDQLGKRLFDLGEVGMFNFFRKMPEHHKQIVILMPTS